MEKELRRSDKDHKAQNCWAVGNLAKAVAEAFVAARARIRRTRPITTQKLEQNQGSLWMPTGDPSRPDVLEDTFVTPIPPGAGTAYSTAHDLRTWGGEQVPTLALHYVETEYLLAGVARTFVGSVNGAVEVASEANPYVTRILVRLPERSADFSGRVMVEPFNTSFRTEREELWARVGGLVQSQGDAWIGVTVRAKAAAKLKKFDAERYADITLPSNDFEWDILGELGTLIKAGGESSPLPHLKVRSVYLGGYSQSAADVATFAMAFHNSVRLQNNSPVYDGYFPAAHAASYTALRAGVDWVPPMEHVTMHGIDVPVIEVQTQSDVEGFSAQLNAVTVVNPGSASVRRPDSDFKRGRYRLYELAGAPHAAQLDGCDGPGSSFPTSAFMRAALKLLWKWAEDGVTPPRARRILLQRRGPVAVARVDSYGNPIGGVRLPHLDIPLARYETHSTPGPICALMGRETLLPIAVLVDKYRDAAAYVTQFGCALDDAIADGYVLPEERELLIDRVASQVRIAFGTKRNREA